MRHNSFSSGSLSRLRHRVASMIPINRPRLAFGAASAAPGRPSAPANPRSDSSDTAEPHSRYRQAPSRPPSRVNATPSRPDNRPGSAQQIHRIGDLARTHKRFRLARRHSAFRSAKPIDNVASLVQQAFVSHHTLESQRPHCKTILAPMGVRRDDKWRDYATLSRNASSAACTASGVPTCIQTPSSRRPNSRSCSLAWSNILVSENSPAGASANSDGDMIAAPA